MRKALFAFLWVCMMLGGFSTKLSAAPPLKAVPLKSDSSVITVRKFDLQKIKDYQTQKDFIYDDVAPVNEGLWDRFWRWFWNSIHGVLKNEYSGGFIKYILIALLAALVIFVAVKFIGLDLKIFSGKSKAVDIPYNESMDNIHEINFSEEVEKAVAKGNYRLAIRLFYLQSLKLLNDKGLIDWQPEKTNQIYIAELKDPIRKEQFSTLTRQFEYIWYGEFFIDKENFKVVKGSFERFNVKIL